MDAYLRGIQNQLDRFFFHHNQLQSFHPEAYAPTFEAARRRWQRRSRVCPRRSAAIWEYGGPRRRFGRSGAQENFPRHRTRMQRRHGIDAAVQRLVANAGGLEPIAHRMPVHEARAHFKSASMDWIVVPSFPAFAALFPASTGMFTLTRNRMDHLHIHDGLLCFRLARSLFRPLDQSQPL